VLSHYDLVSAEDCPERDPRDWLLECVPEHQPVGAASTGSASSIGGGSSSDADGVKWVVLDQRQGQVFSRRHHLRSFVVPEAARVASRRWRLRIVRLAEPAAANSVQLACWNLYSSSSALCVLYAEQQQQQQQISAGCSAPTCMLYINQRDWAAIAQLFARSDGAGAGAAAVVRQMHGTDGAADALETVQRIVQNMHQYPSNAKFWQLGTSGSKIQPVLQHPALLGLLLQLGFRPALTASPGVVASGQTVRLVADESSSDNAGVVRLLRGQGSAR
jgi:hypothetical protein